MTHDEIRTKIAAYRLFDRLKDRVNIKVAVGVADTTIRKAFYKGGQTPLLRLILSEALETIRQHEQEVAAQLANA